VCGTRTTYSASLLPLPQEVVGVFDIDSPTVNGLDEEDAAGLEAIARVLANEGKWDQLKY